MVTDTISDLLTRLRNAQRAGHPSVQVPVSKVSGRILEVLKAEGFIGQVQRKEARQSGFEVYEVGLKYFNSGSPVMGTLKRVSRPGRRIYRKTGDLPKVDSGLGISLISTSQGVMSDREARRRRVGGEVLALIA